jgi:hypothetical protein
LISPQEFWFERLGKIIAPEASDWMAALMGSYPHADPVKKVRTRMGGSEPARFLIGRDFVQTWAPVRPEVPLPGNVTFFLTSERKRRDWLTDVILSPPETPFLAASVGMSGADADNWRMTMTTDLIAIGGAASMFDGQALMLIERPRFLAARDWFRAGQGRVGIAELLRFRDIQEGFRKGLLTGAQARSRQQKLPVSHLRDYPGQDHPMVMRLAAHAATKDEEADA